MREQRKIVTLGEDLDAFDLELALVVLGSMPKDVAWTLFLAHKRERV